MREASEPVDIKGLGHDTHGSSSFKVVQPLVSFWVTHSYLRRVSGFGGAKDPDHMELGRTVVDLCLVQTGTGTGRHGVV